MSKRKPPNKRHTAPRWAKPRALTEAKRIVARSSRLISIYKARANAICTGLAALAEGSGIRPLAVGEPTQVLWSKVNPSGHYTMQPERFKRYRNLINIPEGSPLCN